jgi:hypothetical protein
MRYALTYRKQSLLRAVGSENGDWHTRPPVCQRVYMRYALTYRKQSLPRAVGSENGGWHTRLVCSVCFDIWFLGHPRCAGSGFPLQFLDPLRGSAGFPLQSLARPRQPHELVPKLIDYALKRMVRKLCLRWNKLLEKSV